MAKSSTCNISIRMDSNLKAAAEALYEELGMNLSTAFNIFVRQSLRERGIPFKITEGTPSKETVSAMLEAGGLGIETGKHASAMALGQVGVLPGTQRE